MSRRLLMLVCLLSVGCAGVQKSSSPVPASATEAQLVPGNQVDVLRNGEVFDTLEEELRRAESSIHIILFIWRPGDPSDRILPTILERARAGVRCRVIIDPFWSVGFETEIQPQLEQAGCEVHVFKPLAEVRVPAELVERQHRKLVVIDGRVGITGGFGIWKSWLGNGVGEDQWRDVAAIFRGPVVGQAQQVFARDWRELTGKALGPESFPQLEFEGDTRATFIGSEDPGDEPSKAQKLHDELIAGAQKRVWISNSYFVPSDELSAQLLKKAKQGVDVRVVVPGDRHDMPIVLSAQRSTYRPLTAGGVQIWEYQAAMMHSKTMVIDDRLSVIGSINLDPMSLRQSRECALVTDDPRIADELAEDFRVDESRSLAIVKPAARPRDSLAWLVMWFLGSI